MKAVRLAAAVAFALLAIWAIDFWCWKPYECNLLLQHVRDTSERLEKSSPMSAAALARHNLEQLQTCSDSCRTSIDYYLLAAANDRAIDQREEAVELYRRALEYDRRPEIYFEIGQTLIELHRQHDALPFLITAGYSGSYVDTTIDPVLRQQVIEITSKREAKLRARAK